MKPNRRVAVLTALFVAVFSGPGWAQTNRVHAGLHVGYNFDIEDPNIGVQMSFPIATRLEFYPSFDYYLVGEGNAWGFNGDLKWRVARERPRWFYLGGGVNVTSFRANGGDRDTDLGANLFVGAESLRGRIHPFIEGRAILRDGSMIQLQGGINITL